MKKTAYGGIGILIGILIGRIGYDLIFHQEKLQDLMAYLFDFHFLIMWLLGGIFGTAMIYFVQYFEKK